MDDQVAPEGQARTMNDDSKVAVVLRLIPPLFNGIYKILLLAALAWIGVGLQDVVDAIYSSSEIRTVDPDASDNPDDDNTQPGIIKPLLRG